MAISRELLSKMRKYARKVFNRERKEPANQGIHPSHVASSALRQTESEFGTFASAETHGVEKFAEYGGCIYLNTGDGYTPTVYFRKGKFYVGCWADIVEALADR